MGPAAKVQLLRKNCVSQKTMGAFFCNQSHHIVTTGVMDALPSFSSGARAYLSFCELKGGSPLPGEGERGDSMDLFIPFWPHLL